MSLKRKINNMIRKEMIFKSPEAFDSFVILNTNYKCVEMNTWHRNEKFSFICATFEIDTNIFNKDYTIGNSC